MKIAVLTMTFNNNYGGYLQAYSLMETLKNLGHEPELLFVQLENNDFKTKVKKYIKKYLLSFVFKKYERDRYQKIIEKNTNYFSDKYIVPRTEKIYSSEDFIKYADNYDAYIVGSDQIWRPTMYKFIDQAFFGFVKNNNTILLSYAASFGVDKWEYTEEQTIRFKKEINRFKHVSVREDSGVSLCKEYFGLEAIHLLDPTMLLGIEDYRKIIKEENEPNLDGGLLSYILDKTDDKQYLENLVSKEFELKPYSVNVKSNEAETKLEDKIYPTVTSWLKGFDNAKYVITDSFHGCLFAILFNKPFIVYGNEKRGMARFDSLLKIFGLEDRLILKKEDITIEKIKKEITWNDVNEKLDKYKIISKDFLILNLREQ